MHKQGFYRQAAQLSCSVASGRQEEFPSLGERPCGYLQLAMLGLRATQMRPTLEVLLALSC